MTQGDLGDGLMGRFGKCIAISAAVATGPLLAYAAMSVRDYVAAEQVPDDDFSLEGAFIDPPFDGGHPTPFSGDTIYVYHDRWRGGGFGWGGWGWGGGDECSGWDSGCSDGGGSTGSPPTYADYLADECNMDSLVDSQAQQIMNLIKAQPDWNLREYGAVVYMVGGEIRISPLSRGESVAEAIAAGRQSQETNIQPPSDLGDGVILAVVHSHNQLPNPNQSAQQASDLV